MFYRVILISWIMVSVAVASWAGVAFAAYTIQATALARSNDTKLALTKANQAALNQKVQLLADSTREDRDQLSALAGTDVVAIVDTIDAAGKAAGIEAKVTDASVSTTQQLAKGGDTLRGVVFIVQGAGTFAQIMHAADLYEKLPLLSSVEVFDIERTPSADPKAQWHIVARIKVQTLMSISI